MRFNERMFYVMAAGFLFPLIVSYLVDGWTAKYTSPKFTFDDIPDLTGKVAMVTGANTGIGKITAQELFRKGATVVATARDADRGRAARSDILKETASSTAISADNLISMLLDLSSMESVARFARSFVSKGLQLDILVLNAGVMMSPYSTTKEGFELQFGTNHLGHFLLVKMLLPLIVTSRTRVVVVSSTGHHMPYYPEGIRFDQLTSDKNYDPAMAYGQSKLANILFTYELARQLNGTGVTAHALHPGLIKSDLRRHVDEYFQSHWLLKYIYCVSVAIDYAEMTTADGALTQLYVATTPALNGRTGLYFTPVGVERQSSSLSHNQKLQRSLWDTSMELTAKYAPINVEQAAAAQ